MRQVEGVPEQREQQVQRPRFGRARDERGEGLRQRSSPGIMFWSLSPSLGPLEGLSGCLRCMSRDQLHGCRECSSVVFSIVTMSCSHHHGLLQNISTVPKRNQIPTVVSPHPSAPATGDHGSPSVARTCSFCRAHVGGIRTGQPSVSLRCGRRAELPVQGPGGKLEADWGSSPAAPQAGSPRPAEALREPAPSVTWHGRGGVWQAWPREACPASDVELS